MKSHRSTTLALLFTGSAFLLARPADATTITEWNFNNNAIAINTSPAPSTGNGTASTLGFNSNYNGTASVDTSDINNSTPNSGDAGGANQWRIRGGDGTASPGTGNNGWSSNAPIGSQGAQFLASTAGFTNIQISFDWSPTNQGEGKLQVQYTLDGTTFNNLPAANFSSLGSVAAMAATNTTSANTVMGGYLIATSSTAYMNGITANLSNIAGAANNPNFGLRLVSAATGADDTNPTGTALNNTSGNWRFDEVTISGVPEPSTLALALIGAAGAFVGARRLRHPRA